MANPEKTTAEKQEEHIKFLADANQDFIVAMQAAIIEWQHGKGAEAGLQWIVNTLAGPGFLPDSSAPYGKEAQAWFSANCANPMPTCACGRPSHIVWMGQGFCSEAHYKDAYKASLN